MADLASNDWRARVRARQALTGLRAQAVPSLVVALKDRNWRLRWEAAKTLGEISDPSSAPALVEALEDTRSGIRWLAAEGLIAIGHEALPPLLHALVHYSDSEWLREGAHHVLRAMSSSSLNDLVAPVVRALEGVEPVIEVPLAAQAALDALSRAKGR
jgi:HEAT repeat protein